MPDGFSLKEAAAIAEMPEASVRTAIEKKSIAPRTKSVGKSNRYVFDIKDLFYAKLLSEFPLDLDRKDKEALRNLVFHRADHSGRWHCKDSDFILTSGSLSLHVEVKHLCNRLAHDIAIYHRGRRRIISNPEILSGEPVFEGTRIPLTHITGLIANGVDLAEIREDYPSLSEPDLQFAVIRAKMKPSPGRPRKALEIRRHKSRKSEARRATSP
jgi:uncharacterized protein (DUF433 family)